MPLSSEARNNYIFLDQAVIFLAVFFKKYTAAKLWVSVCLPQKYQCYITQEGWLVLRHVHRGVKTEPKKSENIKRNIIIILSDICRISPWHWDFGSIHVRNSKARPRAQFSVNETDFR